MKKVSLGIMAAAATGALAGRAPAEIVQVQVTAQNLSPATGVATAPLRLGFHSGIYDAFNEGQAASAAIISIAESGSGADWFPAFAAADPAATLGSVPLSPLGPQLPGVTESAVFTVDTDVNPYFTFATMVVPSTDSFIGNDSPTQYLLFDANGNLNFTTISQAGGDVWDAGSEVEIAANAAFLMGSDNSQRVPQNGVVNFNSSVLDTFNGLTTAAGYTFTNPLTADGEFYRITFSIVPEPASAALLGFGLLGLVRRTRR